MGLWRFESTDNTTKQHWAGKWWIESETESFFYDRGLVGNSSGDDFVCEFPDLEKEPGSQITFAQLRELSGGGIAGDNMMEGNEEDPDLFDDAITINQKRNAITSYGALSLQYPADDDLRGWAKNLLKRWMGGTVDQDIFNAAYVSNTKYLYGGDATGTADIEAGDFMELAIVDQFIAYAGKATPEIKGKMMGGVETFLCIMSKDQQFDVKTKDGGWAQAQLEAMKRGKDNPIFKRALGSWADTALYSHKKVATTTAWGSGSNLAGATALFLGVGALAIAYAKKNIWEEKRFDFGNRIGFCVGKIYGVTKAVFNSADNAVVAARTFRSNN